MPFGPVDPTAIQPLFDARRVARPRAVAARRPGGYVLALAVPLVLGTLTARAEVSCPDQLDVQQRASPPAGWAVNYTDVAPRLAGVTLFDGPPANRVSLKYDSRRQSGREVVLAWRLHDSPRSYYLQCAYERTTAVISMPLPPGIRECEVVFDRSSTYPGGGMPVKRTVCR